jgi:hypothetical protein
MWSAWNKVKEELKHKWCHEMKQRKDIVNYWNTNIHGHFETAKQKKHTHTHEFFSLGKAVEMDRDQTYLELGLGICIEKLLSRDRNKNSMKKKYMNTFDNY